jgi:hypothetical protein
MTDFGVEESFQLASLRMKEHHGVEINVSAIRHVTERHAARSAAVEQEISKQVHQPSRQMIIEMDGEMVPLVEYESSKDRRKTKKNLWAELRIGVAQNHHTVTWEYACSFESPDKLGERLKKEMLRLGFNNQTAVHGIGDGAVWIVEQGEKIAGSCYTQLIDLYHLCEYFAGAVSGWSVEVSKETKRQKEMAEQGRIQEIVEELKRKQKEIPQHEG